MRSFSQSLPGEAAAAPAPEAAALGEEEEEVERLSLGDFMNLAYTFSTLYARLHPERKASSAERRRVVPYAEKPLLFGLIAFIIAAASLGLFMLFSPIRC